MNIAFVGNFASKKGSIIFKDLVLELKNKYKWYIFGYTGDTKSYDKIKKYIKISQSYENGQLPQLLTKYNIDLCLILSIWPETYSKTFFEVLDTNTPIIAFKSVGFPEYIFKEYPLFIENNIKSIDDAISMVKEKPDEIKKIISKFNKKNQSIFKEKKQIKIKIIDNLLLR